MERRALNGISDSIYRYAIFMMVLAAIGGIAFAAGLAWSARSVHADEGKKSPRVVYPKKTDLDFEGTQIEGEVRNPGEFYFQHRNEDKFDSLVKRRKNFHQQMLRDAILSK
jgi:hypothetical protein